MEYGGSTSRDLYEFLYDLQLFFEALGLHNLGGHPVANLQVVEFDQSLALATSNMLFVPY